MSIGVKQVPRRVALHLKPFVEVGLGVTDTQVLDRGHLGRRPCMPINEAGDPPSGACATNSTHPDRASASTSVRYRSRSTRRRQRRPVPRRNKSEDPPAELVARGARPPPRARRGGSIRKRWYECVEREERLWRADIEAVALPELHLVMVVDRASGSKKRFSASIRSRTTVGGIRGARKVPRNSRSSVGNQPEQFGARSCSEEAALERPVRPACAPIR